MDKAWYNIVEFHTDKSKLLQEISCHCNKQISGKNQKWNVTLLLLKQSVIWRKGACLSLKSDACNKLSFVSVQWCVDMTYKTCLHARRTLWKYVSKRTARRICWDWWWYEGFVEDPNHKCLPFPLWMWWGREFGFWNLWVKNIKLMPVTPLASLATSV